MTLPAVVGFAALVPAVAVVRAVESRRASLDDRRRTVRALLRLAEVIDECRPAAPDRAADVIARGLVDVLHGLGCRFEPAPWSEPLPVIVADGSLDVVVQHRLPSGIVLPPRTALPAGDAGRFVVLGDPELGTSVDERLVAVALARLLALVAPQAESGAVVSECD